MNNYSKMNPFLAGQLAQLNFENAIKGLHPEYNVVSTFASDYAIADAFGAASVEDTYRRSLTSFSSDIYMLTEMALVLNWAIWRYYELAQDYCSKNEDYENEDKLSRMYDKLWKELDGYIMKNFKGDELEFYLKVTD